MGESSPPGDLEPDARAPHGDAPGAHDGNQADGDHDVVDTRTRSERLAARHHRRKRRSRTLVVVLSVVAVLAVGVAAVAAYLTVKTATVSSKVFGGGGSVMDLIKPSQPLRTDSNGRTNILVFGTSQDDAAHVDGVGGQGMWLTDSIQLISVNPSDKSAEMIAIPRDLWVKQPTKCVVGTASKINAVYECATGQFDTAQSKIPDYPSVDAKGAQALMEVVAQVTGLTPQYYAHINYSVVKQSVDAVGGIDVNVVGDGHEGVFDTNLDLTDCPNEEVSCRAVYYPRDGIYHMDGQHALNFARARADGYSATNPHACMQFGLNGGDFDRQANQQKVMVALKDKATSAGTLANPSSVSNLLDALGNNITTNFSTDEAKSALDLARNLGTMTGINLQDPAGPVLTTGFVGAQSVVKPVAGTYEYTKVAEFIAAKIGLSAASATSSAAPGTTSGTSKPKGSSSTTTSTPAPAPGSTSSGGAAAATSTAKSTYEPPITCSNR